MSDVVGAPKSTNDIQPLGKNLRPLVDVNCSSKLQQGLAQLAGAADVAKARQGRPHAQPREASKQSLQRQGIWQTNQARVTNHHCTMRLARTIEVLAKHMPNQNTITECKIESRGDG